jgi:aspartate carbamoyltransferase regulatory subunit
MGYVRKGPLLDESENFRPEDGSKVLRVVSCTNPHCSMLQKRSTFSTAVRISDFERRRCKKCQLNLKDLVSAVQRGRRLDWHANLKGLRDLRIPELDEMTTFRKFWASEIFCSTKLLELKEKIRYKKKKGNKLKEKEINGVLC